MEAAAISSAVHPEKVTVAVNNKPVVIANPDTTGLKIKEAAVAQGVDIKVTFKLFVLRGDQQIPVANDEPISVHEKEQFRAIAPDDNS